MNAMSQISIMLELFEIPVLLPTMVESHLLSAHYLVGRISVEVD